MQIEIKEGIEPLLLLFPGLGLRPGVFNKSLPGSSATGGIDYYAISQNRVENTFQEICDAIDKFILTKYAKKPIVFLSHSMGSIIAGLCSAKIKPQGWINFEGNLDPRDCFFSRRVIAYERLNFIRRDHQSFFNLLEKSLGINKEPAMAYFLNKIKEIDPGKLWDHSFETVAYTESGKAFNSFMEFKGKKLYINGVKSKISPALAEIKLKDNVAVGEITNAGHFMLYENSKGCQEWIEKFIADL